ncbi:hypothetical protein KBZ15_13875 [Cyanobium sp. BA20m-p-22]|nr:hypothetical protein [Cyanobium sp. BA20m-p-22]
MPLLAARNEEALGQGGRDRCRPAGAVPAQPAGATDRWRRDRGEGAAAG